MVVRVMSLAGGEHGAPARLSVRHGRGGSPPRRAGAGVPTLERGRRRGCLLIAGEAIHDVGWDRGPAGELGLERRDRGDGLVVPCRSTGRTLRHRPRWMG